LQEAFCVTDIGDQTRNVFEVIPDDLAYPMDVGLCQVQPSKVDLDILLDNDLIATGYAPEMLIQSDPVTNRSQSLWNFTEMDETQNLTARFVLDPCGHWPSFCCNPTTTTAEKDHTSLSAALEKLRVLENPEFWSHWLSQIG
jgi:hypothetical protein